MATVRTTALVLAASLVAVLVLRASGLGSGGSGASAGTGSGRRAPLVGRGSPGPTPTGPAPRRVAAAGLDPGLVSAYRQAEADAAAAGHGLVINSGYRTPERQRELLAEEVEKRGSYEAATRWVFPPERSMHVQGLAIDVGDRAAAAWLVDHGSRWGLCHTLAWEWWHFEWRARWQNAGSCPPEARDPSEAPPR